MQPAFEIAEKNRHRLDALFVGEIFQPVFLNLVRGGAISALLLRLQVEFFEFVVRECQEIAQFSGHGYRSVSFAIESRIWAKLRTKFRELKWLVSTSRRETRKNSAC